MFQLLRRCLFHLIFLTFASGAQAMFIQSDWWDPTQPGVGTNRYAYSQNDPVNLFDPLGNSAENPTLGDKAVDKAAKGLKSFLEKLFPQKDWGRRDAVATIPGVDLVPGVSVAIAAEDPQKSSGDVALEAALEAVGPIADIAKATRSIGNNIWASRKKVGSARNAQQHWKKHKDEFPEFATEEEYVRGANDFVNSPPAGTRTRVRPNGETVYYNQDTNTFAVVSSSGEVKTMFRPSPSRHGFASNIDYYNAQ